MTSDDVPSLLFEIGQLFTPSTPIRLADLFAGRRRQIGQLLNAVAEPGRHAILYGERGVGKTSLSQVLALFVPAGRQTVVHARKACAPGDTYETIWRKFFKDMQFTHVEDGEQRVASLNDVYTGRELEPDDILREMKTFSANDIPIFVVDEFNEIEDAGETAKLFANTIKALSDDGVPATIVIVGVGDSVSQLFAGHESIQRCTEEVPMPRMSRDELGEIIDTRLKALGLNIEPDARWKIIILARGLPTYVHRLGKHAAGRAVSDLRRRINEEDVDYSIEEVLRGSLESLRVGYERAIYSNQPGSLFKEILLSCALAPADDAGYFAPAAVLTPFEKIRGKPMTIAQYRNHLADFITEKRGSILQRKGEERGYRYRFRDPAMLPYVLMKGIADGMVSEDAKGLLRFPEQGQLFADSPEWIRCQSDWYGRCSWHAAGGPFTSH
ncbi:ATP-binding protein [Sphingomonas sp. 7/4-4]|uniref:nSTAND1 domain-containing NTPase n=1 Tax=Sphingomonas sp. 7/4-4 TaxID=3018446 RepID=UPI0022F3D420|nr:ATP-binding protein [Sphingomonas sp. 7/4-4]WBY06680.1 ATP-binding protein [Sphingomonas sp. 7/4-4]